jgi:hypothetical protein
MSAPNELRPGDGILTGDLVPVGASSDASLSREEAFDVLSSERRRRVLGYLLDVDDRTALRDLLQVLAAWENDVGVEEIASQQRKRVYTALKQFHLPKMDRAGVTDYDDDDRGTVTLADAARNLRVYLEIVPDREISWSEYYLGLGAVSAAAVAAARIGTLSFGAVPGLVLAGLIALALTLSAGAHVYATRRYRLEWTRPPLDGDV